MTPDDLISRADALALFEANENIPTQTVRALIKCLSTTSDTYVAWLEAALRLIGKDVEYAPDFGVIPSAVANIANRALAARPMTPTPVDASPAPDAGSNALAEAAMRTAAASAAEDHGEPGCYQAMSTAFREGYADAGQHISAAILALPLTATPAQLLAEAAMRTAAARICEDRNDEIWDKDTLLETMVMGGKYIGFCDYRPRYGKFEVFAD